MGDDEHFPAGHSVSHGSSNANNYFINNFGRTGLILVVVGVGLSLGISIGLAVTLPWMQSIHERKLTAQVQAVERRVMDRASLAEREARIAQDKYWYLKSAVEARGIKVEEH